MDNRAVKEWWDDAQATIAEARRKIEGALAQLNYATDAAFLQARGRTGIAQGLLREVHRDLSTLQPPW